MGLELKRIDDFRYEIPARGKMRVPGRIYASERMMRDIQKDKSPEQVANVAHLPGILKYSFAMPDIHWGYGFPIGGVAAFDEDEGVLSPGGVGYDINCGVRLLRTNVDRSELADRIEDLSLALHRAIPSGVGSKSHRSLSARELDDVLRTGARWALSNGYARTADLEVIEEGGCFQGADPSVVSERAKDRGRPQLGSLGSGNHFAELGYVSEIYDEVAARAFGLELGKITLMIHSGSRGFGYQVCDDSLRMMLRASRQYKIELPDRQLCAAPLGSPEAQTYFSAMACAINFAFANRQMMTHFVRQAMSEFLGRSDVALGLELVYDVCHNIAKWEDHEVDGKTRRVCVHRKGATRSFGPGHEKVPAKYRSVGQPVLVPGDMGRYSFVLAGSNRAMDETFGSCCHGAGRHLSRAAAKKAAKGRSIFRELQQVGIFVRSDDKGTVEEEIPEAYKDVSDVVEVVHGAGLAQKVAKLVPLAVVKG
ncbi:MAG: RtcB family protein [Deltaproteobacteria bacterium]|nr:RtcB family protein [Deltaproteobacteria bacterium]